MATEETVTFVTPVGQVLFNNLKTPNVFNGKAKFDIMLAFDTTLKSTSEFVKIIRSAEAEITGGKGEVSFSPIKPRKVKNKATKQLEEHATEIAITFKSDEAPVVLNGSINDEEATRVTGEDLILPYSASAEAEFELISYNFEIKNKDTGEVEKVVKGVSLKLLAVGVINRPEKKANVFKRK
jgi:hypothetical protein